MRLQRILGCAYAASTPYFLMETIVISIRFADGLGEMASDAQTAHMGYGFHSSNGNHSYFDTHDLRGGGSRIELSMRQEEDARWGCSHAMAVGNDVVAEARVCLLGKDTAPVVNNLLDQIVAKVPQ